MDRGTSARLGTQPESRSESHILIEVYALFKGTSSLVEVPISGQRPYPPRRWRKADRIALPGATSLQFGSHEHLTAEEPNGARRLNRLFP